MIQSIFRDDLFRDKVALVTGGGSGIGLRTASELASLGAKIVLVGRNESKLKAALDRFPDQEQVTYQICNIRDEEAVTSCFSDAIQHFGHLDYLINNAGGQFPSPAAHMSKKGWDAVIDTNLTGTFLMCRSAFHAYFKDHGGVIVNVIANMWKGFPMMAHTGAARAGVDNLTKSLAAEWSAFGVRVNAVAPGIINSSGLAQYPEEVQQKIAAAAAFNHTGRLGTEAEVAASILFLLSPAAAFISGETLKVDGGEWLYNPMWPPSKPKNPESPWAAT